MILPKTESKQYTTSNNNSCEFNMGTTIHTRVWRDHPVVHQYSPGMVPLNGSIYRLEVITPQHGGRSNETHPSLYPHSQNNRSHTSRRPRFEWDKHLMVNPGPNCDDS